MISLYQLYKLASDLLGAFNPNTDALNNVRIITSSIGLVILFIGGIQAVITSKDDHPLLMQRLILIMAVIFTTTIFSKILSFVYDTTVKTVEASRSNLASTDFDLLFEIEKDNNKKEEQESKGWFSKTIKSIKNTFSFYFYFLRLVNLMIIRRLVQLCIFLPNMMRLFSLNLVKFLLLFASLIAPIFLPMITVRQTENSGWRFVLVCIGLSLSPIMYPIVDYAVPQFAFSLLSLCAVLVAPSAATMALSITELILVITKAMASLNVVGLIALALTVAIALILIVITALAGYFIAPFVFAYLFASGDVVQSLSHGLSSSVSQSQRHVGAIIESSEAGARSAAKASEIRSGINFIREHAGVAQSVAKQAYQMSGGSIQNAIDLANKIEKQMYVNPKLRPPENIPASMKKTI